MKYRIILFDADGTLFDYQQAEGRSFRLALESCGIEPSAELMELYRHINGELWRALEAGDITADRLRIDRFERLLVEGGLVGEAPDLSDAYVRHLSRSVDLLPGARQLLESLYGRVVLALVTNGITEIQRSRLERSGLDRFFPVVVISGEVGVAKPDPRFFQETFRRLGEPAKHEVLIVGDSLTSDIRGGAAFGIDTCWFNPERRPREPGDSVRYEIIHLAELPGVLEDT